MLPPSSLLKYYEIILKATKQALKSKTFDNLIIRHQSIVSHQRHIVFINIADGFYEALVNVADKVPNSKAILIKHFIHRYCKVLGIEPTGNSQHLGKWILLVNNDDYSHAKNKLKKLIKCILKKEHSLQTMTSSLKHFKHI